MEVINKIRHELYKLSDDGLDSDNLFLIEKLINNYTGSIIKNYSDDKNQLTREFNYILETNEVLGLRLLFYIRDPKGLGKRELFRILIKYIAFTKTNLLRSNLNNIVIFGRYDDLYALFDTPLENDVIFLIKQQLIEDIKSETPSLLCKWLKSENCSSLDSRKLATKTRKLLGLTSKEYRILLSRLRKKICLFENILTSKEKYPLNAKKITIGNYKKYHIWFKKNEIFAFDKFNSKHLNNNKLQFLRDLLTNSDALVNYNNIYDELIKDTEFSDIEDSLLVINFEILHGFRNINNDIFLAIYIIIINSFLSNNEFKNYFMHSSSKLTAKFSKLYKNNLNSTFKYLLNSECKTIINISEYLELLLFTALKKNYTNSQLPKRVIFLCDDSIDISKLRYTEEKYRSSNYTFPQVVIYYNNSHIKIQEEILNNDNIIVINSLWMKGIDFLFKKDIDLTNKNILKNTFNLITSKRYDVINKE